MLQGFQLHLLLYLPTYLPTYVLFPTLAGYPMWLSVDDNHFTAQVARILLQTTDGLFEVSKGTPCTGEGSRRGRTVWTDPAGPR